MARILRAGALYFGMVFAVGFALGLVRVLWMVPQFGVRAAELIEAPFMLTATFLAARWTVRAGSGRGCACEPSRYAT
jgi:hypothetical protein